MKMEDVCEVLTMLEEEITKIHQLCMRRRKETECCVQQCRQLLKPWPLELKKSEEATVNTEKSSLIQSNNPAVEGLEVESKAKDVERQDLAALDGLLAKAQRAREIQTKIDKAAGKSNQKTTYKKPIPVTNAPVKQTPQQAAKQSHPAKSIKPASKKTTAARKPAAKTERPAIKSTYSASYGRPPSAKSLIRPASSKGSSKVYLDTVLKRDAKGKPLINDSKKQESAEGSSGGAPKWNATSASGEKDPRTHEVSHNLKNPSSEEKHSSSFAEPLDMSSCNKESIENSGQFQSSQLRCDMDRKPGNVARKSPEFSGLRQSNLEARDFESEKQESFDPFAEESELKLPINYRKLKVTSTKLYSEVEKIAEKRERSSPYQQFLDRLESVFDMEGISSHGELQERANGLLKEHEKLSRLTSDVVNRSYNLSDDSPWPEVYKCYRYWQIVLNKFNELQRSTQQLLEAEEQLSKVCPCGKCDFFDREDPRDASSYQDEADRQEGFVLLSSWLPEEIEDFCQSCQNISRRYGMAEFTYSSPKELSELIRLHHEAQLLCLQLHMKKLAGEKLLPLLEKLGPSDSTFVPLYRKIHGFLCGDSKVFPALVLDNL